MTGPYMDECYYAYDAHANVTDLVTHYAYDAFGQATAQADTLADANPYRFSTNHPDNKVSIYHYGLRHYSPELGRWVSRDPIGEYAFRLKYFRELAADESQRAESRFPGREGRRNLRRHLKALAEDIEMQALDPSYLFVKNEPAGHVDPRGLAGYPPGVRCRCCASIIGNNVLIMLNQLGIDHESTAARQGGADAFKHCVGSCLTARVCGARCSEWFWRQREDGDPSSPYTQQDLENNALGLQAAQQTGTPCWEACRSMWEDGDLRCTNTGESGLTDCPPPPDTFPENPFE